LAEQHVILATRLGDRSRLADANGNLGIALWQLGHLTTGRVYLERSAGEAEYQWQNAAGIAPEQHLGAGVRRHLALVLWHLGYPEQALRKMEEALALVEAVSHPNSQVVALVWSTWLYQICREPRLAQVQAERTMVHSQQHGFRYWYFRSLIFYGWALAQQGDVAEGIGHIQSGMEQQHDVEGWLHQPAYLALQAECYGLAGQPEQGLPLLEEGLKRAAATGECIKEAELHRLQGELQQMCGADVQQIESCFQRALAVARQQQAKSLELRAAMSLSRLWQQQGKQAQAHELLSAIYAWFSEGFDTRDLQQAKALLASLA
jgi:predicted ATPase